MRVRLDEPIISGNDLKLTFKGKKKKYKAGKISKKEWKNLAMYVENGANCECTRLNSIGNKDKAIIVGERKDGKVVVTHIFKYEKSSKDLRNAMKAIQKPDTCKKGLGAITEMGDEGKDGKGKKDEAKGNKGGKKKNDRKGKGKDRNAEKNNRRGERNRNERRSKKKDSDREGMRTAGRNEGRRERKRN